MKKIAQHIHLVIVAIVFNGFSCMAQEAVVTTDANSKMHTYVIERDIPKAGQFSAEKLKAISQTSCSMLSAMGPKFSGITVMLQKTKYSVFTKQRI